MDFNGARDDGVAFERALSDILDLLRAGRQFGVKRDLDEYGADVHGVRQLIIYGLKGMGSYARHARLLGEWDDSIGAFTSEVTALVKSRSCRHTIHIIYAQLQMLRGP